VRSRRDERFRVRWWQVATVALLALALGLSVAAGRRVEGAIIGGFLAVYLALFVAVWVLHARGGRH
jgi:hypothetical protein